MSRFASKIKDLLKNMEHEERKKEENIIDYIISTPSLARTITLIRGYIKETKRKCFSYNSIKSYAARTGFYSEYTDRTLDRSIRKLVELGVLYRTRYRKDKRIVFFCPTKLFYRVLERITVVEGGKA